MIIIEEFRHIKSNNFYFNNCVRNMSLETAIYAAYVILSNLVINWSNDSSWHLLRRRCEQVIGIDLRKQMTVV